MTASRKVLTLVSLSALLLGPGTIDAAGQNGREPKPAGKYAKLDKTLREGLEKGDRGKQRVIIRAKKGLRAGVRSVLELNANEIKGEHPSIEGVTAVVDADVLEALASAAAIESISIDAVVRALQQPAVSGTDTAVANTLRSTLGLTPSSPRGDGIGVAVVDSGIDPEGDFGSRITHFYDFTNGGVATAPVDDYGHGTHVAGLIGSNGGSSDGEFEGVAPGVRLVGLRVLDGVGEGYTSDVISAIEFATANMAALDIDVLNLSLGHPILEDAASDPLVQAVEASVRARPHRRRLRRQRRGQPDNWRAGVLRDPVARERAVGVCWRSCESAEF